MDSTTSITTDLSAKRPRSPSFADLGPPAPKAAKIHGSHLQINYLARQYQENIPLVNAEDTLPSILRLIGDYDGVLHRHESMAGNLGACPLGPILLKRFERLFDGPPRILKSHGKEASVSWLDVVEFARNKPEQFNLDKVRDGVRVCQFYTKQSRVEISEEDYVLIASGMPQKLIPPQPIIEDEEKELAALDILEKNLSQIISLADQVSARARQLNHRLKNRKAAIMSRHEVEATPGHSQGAVSRSPPPEAVNGYVRQNGSSASVTSPSAGFTAVNTRTSTTESPDFAEGAATPSVSLFPSVNPEKVTVVNGTNLKGVSPETRNELVRQFITTADREVRTHLAQAQDDRRLSQGFPRPSSSTRTKPRSESDDYTGAYVSSPTTVAIPSTPASLLPHLKATQAERDDGGPYKAEMVARMEQMHRGERVLPPCDRCRRLHMDCLKNLTACMGCTKKHAKCSWKDVREEELHEHGMPQDDMDIIDDRDRYETTERNVSHDEPLTQSSMTSPPPPQLNNRRSESDSLPPAPQRKSYSTEEDDLTRAILEEKEEPEDRSPTFSRERPSTAPHSSAPESTAPAQSSAPIERRQIAEAASAAAATISTHRSPDTQKSMSTSASPNIKPLSPSTTTNTLPPLSAAVQAMTQCPNTRGFPRPSSNPQFPHLSSTNRPEFQHISRPKSGGDMRDKRYDERRRDDSGEEVEGGDEDVESEDEGDRLMMAAREVWRRGSGSVPSGGSRP